MTRAVTNDYFDILSIIETNNTNNRIYSSHTHSMALIHQSAFKFSLNFTQNYDF